MAQHPDTEWHQAWEIAHHLETSPSETNAKGEEPEEGQELCPLCETRTSVHMDAAGLRLICGVCGTVVENFTDESPEWTNRQEIRMYGRDPTRGEAINQLMPHASMSTDIVATGRFAYRQFKMIKLNRWSAEIRQIVRSVRIELLLGVNHDCWFLKLP